MGFGRLAPRWLSSSRVVVAGTVSIAVVVTGLTAAQAASKPASVRLVADTYISESNPRAVNGDADKLVASSNEGDSKVQFLKFRVSGIEDGDRVAAKLTLTRDDHHFPNTKVSIAEVASTDWKESSLNKLNAPAIGDVIDTKAVTASDDDVTFELGKTIDSDGLYAFAITSPVTDDVVRFRSKEYGSKAAKLKLDVVPAPTPTTKPKPIPAPTPTTIFDPGTTTTTEPDQIPTPPTTAVPGTPPTTPEPTTTTTTAAPGTPPTVPPVGQAKFTRNGIPLNGGVLVGAGIGGNTDPAAQEAQFGNKLALHRLFYQSNQVSKAVSAARADLALGRLPWVSFKLPYSWSEMAAGKGDAWAADIANQMGALDGPVWIAFHHEPEKDGPIADWTALQSRLSPIVKAKPNLAFTIIITGWTNFFSGDATYNIATMWPGDGKVDIIGMDPYNKYGVTENGKLNTTNTDLKTYYDILAPFAKAHGAKWAVAETGYTSKAAAIDPNWLIRAYDDMKAAGGIGLTYFDSSLNSVGDSDWPLNTTPSKVAAFSELLKRSTRLP